MSFLGVAPEDRPATLPQIEGFPGAFGALYVVEGSRLGGRVLARQVSAGLGPGVSGALGFLRGDGANAVGTLWKELRTALAAYAEQADERTRAAIVAGALDTFACFDRQLAGWEP
jgi:heme oxygenase (biliverdin-IX-beta and delta-forming)